MFAPKPHEIIAAAACTCTLTTLGITGHRVLADPAAVADSIRTVITAMSPSRLVLLSPLAEGTDRLAAHEVLAVPGATLHAVLPLAPREYESDFATSVSRDEFRDLLSRAVIITIAPVSASRGEAYFAAGCRIVDDSDILLAVWDGRPARGIGGTAGVVACAREHAKPVIIIDSADPSRIVCERL